MGSRFALALARDGQRLRLDVFKGLVAAVRGNFPSFPTGRSPLAGRSARSRPHDDDDDDERDNRGGRWIGREQKCKLKKYQPFPASAFPPP